MLRCCCCCSFGLSSADERLVVAVGGGFIVRKEGRKNRGSRGGVTPAGLGLAWLGLGRV